MHEQNFYINNSIEYKCYDSYNMTMFMKKKMSIYLPIDLRPYMTHGNSNLLE